MEKTEGQRSKASLLKQQFSEETLPLVVQMRKARDEGDDELFMKLRNSLIDSYYELDKRLAEVDGSQIHALSNKYRGKVSDADDIEAYAYFGLLKACFSYDPSNEVNASFLTYSYVVMEQEILNSIQSSSTIPVSAIRNKRIIDQAEIDLRKELEREPTDEELFEAVSKISDKITLKGIQRLRGVNLNMFKTETDDGFLDNGIARNGIKDVGTDGEDPKKTFSDNFDKDVVRKIVLDDDNDVLTKQEKVLARKMFYEGKTISEICREIGLSRSIVEALKKAMYEKIRNALN